jgi:hypothetical protein
MSLPALRFVPAPDGVSSCVFFVLDEELLYEELLDEQLLAEELLDEQLLDEELLDEELLDEELLDEELLDEELLDGAGTFSGTFSCSLMNSRDLQTGLT